MNTLDEASGNMFWLLISILVIVSLIFIFLMYLIFRTNRSKNQVLNKYVELSKKAAVSEQSNKLKSEFLANVTHELRSPIGAVLGYAELVQAFECTEAERYDHIESIIRNGKHLLSIVNDILDLSKVEAGLLEVEKVTFSLHLELHNIISTYKKEANRKGLDIQLNYIYPIPECIISDPTRFRQILINLLSNAIKFTEKGEIIVKVNMDENNPERLFLRVKDTGIGVLVDQKEKLFTPFMQADASITRKYGGTGLGLSLSRKIARTMGGNLTLESSELGEGSVFCLEINTGNLKNTRWIKSSAELNNLTLPSFLETDSNSLKGIKILIVDDSKDNQVIYLQYLESAGAIVSLASDGKEGQMLALSNEFDVILMDIQMPIQDGYTTTKYLRDNGYEDPILALTANAMKGERERCIDSGCNDYLTKPVDPDTLIEIIANISRKKPEPSKLEKEGSIAYLYSAKKSGPALKVPLNKGHNGAIRSLYEDDPRVSVVIGSFILGLQDRVSSLKQAVRDSDYTRLSALAHSLRGSSATYGFPELAKLAEKLEQEAKAPSCTDTKNILIHVARIQSLAIKMSHR